MVSIKQSKFSLYVFHKFLLIGMSCILFVIYSMAKQVFCPFLQDYNFFLHSILFIVINNTHINYLLEIFDTD